MQSFTSTWVQQNLCVQWMAWNLYMEQRLRHIHMWHNLLSHPPGRVAHRHLLLLPFLTHTKKSSKDRCNRGIEITIWEWKTQHLKNHIQLERNFWVNSIKVWRGNSLWQKTREGKSIFHKFIRLSYIPFHSWHAGWFGWSGCCVNLCIHTRWSCNNTLPVRHNTEIYCLYLPLLSAVFRLFYCTKTYGSFFAERIWDLLGGKEVFLWKCRHFVEFFSTSGVSKKDLNDIRKIWLIHV